MPPSANKPEPVVGKLPEMVVLLVAFNNKLDGVTGEYEDKGEVGALWYDDDAEGPKRDDMKGATRMQPHAPPLAVE